MCQISEKLIQEGRNMEKFEIINNMLRKDKSIDEISKLTDMSFEEINNILKRFGGGKNEYV